MSTVLPNPFYYLENFERVLGWITQRYDDLLADEERHFITRFCMLPQTSRALLVRMVMRKGSLFRSGKLRYDEIGCPDRAAQALIAEGWLAHDPLLSIEEVFVLLRKTEITQAFGFSGQTKNARKTELLEALRHEFPEPRPLTCWHHGSDECIYQVKIVPLCERLRLMFFGNLHQTWSEFVLSDLGIYRYEQVEFSSSSRAFIARQDVDDYLHLHRCRERFDQGELLDDILPDVPAQTFSNTWLEGRRNKLLFKIGQQYERCAELQSALDIYRRCTYPGARIRAIRVLERCEDFDAAHRLAEMASNAPESEAELQTLQRMLPRLRRKLGHAKSPTVKRHALERIDLTLPLPEEAMSVEAIVGHHFSDEHCTVQYVENTLINSLFGLLCWPAIFAAVPGAFFHPFHHGPADLHSPDFHQRRIDRFAECMAQLDSDRYKQTIIENFRAKFSIQSPFVFWSMLDEELLTLALRCLPALHLKKWFERMLLDIPANRSGFPDLIQFWPQQNRYRMLEVKGPGDRLQDNQIRWLNYCVTHQMPVAVCYVQWLGQAA
jgi:hypothetical protein